MSNKKKTSSKTGTVKPEKEREWVGAEAAANWPEGITVLSREPDKKEIKHEWWRPDWATSIHPKGTVFAKDE